HDTVHLEGAGRPTVVLATEKFADLAAQAGKQCGLENARIATLEHPVGGVDKDELLRRADASVDHVIRLLTSTG
ncbi:MAG: hypothetical protein QMC73_07915, partial [Myxococcota bacterium]